jgi:hypothetical protein
MVGSSRAKDIMMRSLRITGREAGDCSLCSARATHRQEIAPVEDAPLSLAIELEGQCYARLRSSKDSAKGSKPSPPKRPQNFRGR